ncbi:glycosyltransferase family 4 protein [Terriglobus albidus]|uniref:glycosyltransferase family 4 protein n=1 Tax=Terriglobus albidus TaxID=1592106 RepID=UPI0021E088A2|nr:glycosyltransferase family 4 protein [Terriglobus albidus]
MIIAICAPVDIHALARFKGVDFTDIPRGMGSTATTPLVIEFLRRGHEVVIYTLSYALEKPIDVSWGNLRLVVGSSRQFGAARSFYWPEIKFLQKAISADSPAFVHAHWTYEFALGALLSGVPTFITIHDLPWNVLRYFRDRCRTVRLLMAYAVSLKGRSYSAVSRDAARHFSRYLRPGAEVEVIPNFLSDLVVGKSKGPRLHPDRALVFACVIQGWTARKNAGAALRAFAKFNRAYPESRLLMIGHDYQEGGGACLWAQKQNLTRGVNFVGPLEYPAMLDRVVADVDVLLMPSLDEAFSMTVLENMALANPIIAGNTTPGIREQLADGQAGLIVNVRSPDAIFSAMVRLQTDKELFQQISASAHRRALTEFTAEQVVPKYEQWYSNSIRHRSLPPARGEQC